MNPDHLIAGTRGDNMADMKAKGRGKTSDRAGMKHPLCKYTDQQVLAMRARRRDGGTYQSICDEFGITSTGYAWRLVNVGWAYLTPAGTPVGSVQDPVRRVLTPHRVAEIKALHSAGASQSAVARLTGLPRRTVQNALAEDEVRGHPLTVVGGAAGVWDAQGCPKG